MKRLSLLLLCFLVTPHAHAWGRRGHSIVCQTAAALLTDHPVLKQHSFDLGFYCNVPDLVWKKPATYATEAPQHFMDLEIFDRAFAKLNLVDDPFKMSRRDFDKSYSQVPVSAGRAYWRIRELMDRLDGIAKSLTSVGAAKAARFGAQENWLVTAGAIGHYVGDLSQPLHVTENYDGQLSGQKGVHAWFEDDSVDELSTAPPARLEADVGAIASQKWKSFDQKTRPLSVLEVLKELAQESKDEFPTLLKIDKNVGRKDIKKASAAFEPMIKSRLAAGALALAALWSRELDWKYDGEKFYNFNGAPEYIDPLVTAAPRPTALLSTPAGPTPKP